MPGHDSCKATEPRNDEGEIVLNASANVCISRIIDGRNAHILEHAHDRPVLSLFIAGSYTNNTELGEIAFDGPSAVLYRAGERHFNVAGERGFEQIQIEFDPGWLGLGRWLEDVPVRHWRLGPQIASCKQLARLLSKGGYSSDMAAHALRRFIGAEPLTRGAAPEWLAYVEAALSSEDRISTSRLAERIGVSPAWLTASYRWWKGEGISEVLQRKRVELAADLLRRTNDPAADIAARAGFCDQSHMIRCFKKVLGRTPLHIRSERNRLRTPGPDTSPQGLWDG